VKIVLPSLLIYRSPGYLIPGKIKFKEEVSNGLESVGDVSLVVKKDKNKSKAVVHVAYE